MSASRVLPDREFVWGDGRGAERQYPSDAIEGDSRSKGLCHRFEVVLVGGEDSEPTLVRDRDDVYIDDVGTTRSARERPDAVCVVISEWHDVAASQEASELGLSPRPTHLGYDRGGRSGYEA